MSGLETGFADPSNALNALGASDVFVGIAMVTGLPSASLALPEMIVFRPAPFQVSVQLRTSSNLPGRSPVERHQRRAQS